ncbi:MAG TPA: HEAT repeat domain-containing protein [Candidatus Obscuribacterales bacterium]
MLNVLEQAIVAAKDCNWSLVNECLQQLPLGKKVTEGDAASPPLEDGDLEQVLSLALNVLDNGDFQQRWDVAKLFTKLGDRAIAPLIEILEDEDADLELRWFAGRILGEFNHPSVVTSLVEMLRTSEDEELVEMATTTLANLGSSAIDALTALLTDSESRLLAVRSLSQIRHSYTVTPLLSVVNDELLQVRVAAIEALSSFHDSRIGPVLIEALNDLAAPVRKEAAIALGLRTDLREELDLVNRLKPLLYDFNLEVCTAAAIALGRMGTNEAAAALFEVLKSPATPIPLQVALVRALSWMGTADALEYLRPALTMTQVEVCLEIVTLLGRMEKPDLRPKAAQILIDFLSSGQPTAHHTSVKQSLALALGQLANTGAIDELIQMLADSDASVRLHAIAALKKLAPEDAHRQLQQLADTENLTPGLKQGVAIALQEWQLT